MKAAKQRGHEARDINLLKCYLCITTHRPEIYYPQKRLDGFDAVIPRIGASITFYGLAVLRQFEMMGVYCLNESAAIGRSNKLRSLSFWPKKASVPVTTFPQPRRHQECDRIGQRSLVLKLLEVTQGVGVVMPETNKAAERVSSKPFEE